MEILIINGSPKGKHSVTLQTLNYLEILHPEDVYYANALAVKKMVQVWQEKCGGIPEGRFLLKWKQDVPAGFKPASELSLCGLCCT